MIAGDGEHARTFQDGAGFPEIPRTVGDVSDREHCLDRASAEVLERLAQTRDLAVNVAEQTRAREHTGESVVEASSA